MSVSSILKRKSLGLNMFGLLVLLFGALLPGAPAAAQTAAEDPEAAKAFITALSEDALEVLNDTTLTQDERDQRFRDLLSAGFDLDYISKLVLGRHRRGAPAALLKEYQEVFPEYVIRIYSSRLTEYGDEEFVVTDTAPAGKSDIYVRSQIVRPQGPPVAADWRVRMTDDGLKIIDLKVEGISMAITQRDEFSARISQVGLEGLIAEMRADAGLDHAQAGETRSAATP